MAPGRLAAFLDTHAVVFLFDGRVDLFGPISKRILERADLLVSPIVRLELKFLKEVGKIGVEPETIFRGLRTSCGLTEVEADFKRVVEYAIPLKWTRDPFDRLIVATALMHQTMLITKDRKIQAHLTGAIW